MPDDVFELFDLEIEVIGSDRPMVCNHQIGDRLFLSGENLSMPAGQSFPLYPLAALLPPQPARAMPADLARVDTAAIEACIAAATTQGGVYDCAGRGQDACVANLREAYKDVGPVESAPVLCLKVEAEYWDKRLTTGYDALVGIESGRSAARLGALRAMERAWIAFRDDRCAYETLANGGGTGGDQAGPLCLLQETARQSALIDAMLHDRGHGNPITGQP